MAWYAHYMSDYDRDTQHLSLTENGAYQRLLSYYYDKRRPLPADSPTLFRICRAFTPDEQAAVQAVLGQFFNQQSDGWHQKRADEEIEKAKEISAVRAAAARNRNNGKSEVTNAEGKAKAVKVESERTVATNEQQTHQQTESKCLANDPANDQHLHTQDHNTQNTDHISNNSQNTDHKKTEKTRAGKPRGTTRIKVCDDEFIAELQAEPAYKDLPVKDVYNKMVVYCRVRGKQPTRGRLINWLNREDRPMAREGGNGTSDTSNYQGSAQRRQSAFEQQQAVVDELRSRSSGTAS